MKFSESWLRTLVNPTLSSEELSHLLTMAGLEVEDMAPVAPVFHSVVVAQVLEVVKHPDADRLNVCQVDIGDGSPKQIVCGAPNVAAGLKVPCALPGAEFSLVVRGQARTVLFLEFTADPIWRLEDGEIDGQTVYVPLFKFLEV